jgi:hypothetical protein
MTVERSILVVVPRTEDVSGLVHDIVSAARRAHKADPGDRTDVVRYESLCVQLEETAAEVLREDPTSRIATDAEVVPVGPGFSFEDALFAENPEVQGVQSLGVRLPDRLASLVRGQAQQATVVELRLALESGVPEGADSCVAAPGPAEPWAVKGDAVGGEAVEQRFREQLESVTSAAPADRTRGYAITPSGVRNRVITRTLRSYVPGHADSRVDAPVTYRDGSRAAHDFPLRCLPLRDQLPQLHVDLTLHLALLSIRHTEMDAVVDGAFLRNAEVSRPRPAAVTDDFVYETSRTQLSQLTDGGRRRVLLHIYQTGLDTAVMGFYRAVVGHLLVSPYSVSVVPMYYVASAASDGLSQEARFRPDNRPWTMGNRP